MRASQNIAEPTEDPVAESETALPDGAMDNAFCAELDRAFATEPAYRLAQNALTNVPLEQVALNRVRFNETCHSFSHLLDNWPVTDQKQSGRCWLFAGLNLLRVGTMRELRLKAFEFSQCHALFWDKLERANYWLEAIIDTIDLPLDDRTVAHLLSQPLEDGGQWTMFVNIVKKHGVVPKDLMPETESAGNTRRMNAQLVAKLREGAKLIRDGAAAGRSGDALRCIKQEILTIIHRILCIHLGTPPTSFDWQWQDKDRAFHRAGNITPVQFAEQYITIDLDDYVCLVHDPRSCHPPAKTYTVQYLGNVVGGEQVKYLNVEMAVMKEQAMNAIMAGEPVWFGCDAGKMLHRDHGIWDAELYDVEGIYGTRFELGKDARLEYHQGAMTHAMLFTGVDVVDAKPRRWRVENSWGNKVGRKGFYVMNDNWFDQHVFEIAARKSSLSQTLRDAAALDPVILPPWDPMGSLARLPRPWCP